MRLKEIFEENPVIPAIRNYQNLEEAIKSSSEIVFIINSNLIDIYDIVSKLKENNKKVFIHVDMLEGLSSSTYAVEYIIKQLKPYGIITTKHNIVALAKKQNVKVIQRFFILDSLSLERTISNIKENKPDIVDILPGLMPKVIKKISNETKQIIIAGGLIESKADIILALNSGAVSVSTTDSKIWEI